MFTKSQYKVNRRLNQNQTPNLQWIRVGSQGHVRRVERLLADEGRGQKLPKGASLSGWQDRFHDRQRLGVESPGKDDEGGSSVHQPISKETRLQRVRIEERARRILPWPAQSRYGVRWDRYRASLRKGHEEGVGILAVGNIWRR